MTNTGAALGPVTPRIGGAGAYRSPQRGSQPDVRQYRAIGVKRHFRGRGTLDIVAKDLRLAYNLARDVAAPAHLGLLAHDQVDSTAQLLDWFKRGAAPSSNAGIFELYRQCAEVLRSGEARRGRLLRLRAPRAVGAVQLLFRGLPQCRGRRHRRDVAIRCGAAAGGGVGLRRHGRLAAVSLSQQELRPVASRSTAELQRIYDRIGEGGAEPGMTEEKLAEILADESQ